MAPEVWGVHDFTLIYDTCYIICRSWVYVYGLMTLVCLFVWIGLDLSDSFVSDLFYVYHCGIIPLIKSHLSDKTHHLK